VPAATDDLSNMAANSSARSSITQVVHEARSMLHSHSAVTKRNADRGPGAEERGINLRHNRREYTVFGAPRHASALMRQSATLV
jgi:hypothetical protein